MTCAVLLATPPAARQFPADRPIDGIDQTEFFLGKKSRSNRQSTLIYISGELHAVKWRDWKVHYFGEIEAPSGRDLRGKIKLEVPYVFNLLRDPKEETDVRTASHWVLAPVTRVVAEFQKSLKTFPPIEPGTPDPYEPPSPK